MIINLHTINNFVTFEAFTDGSTLGNGSKNALGGIGIFFPQSTDTKHISLNYAKFVIENPLDVARHSHPVEERKTEFNIKVAGLEIEEGELLIFPAYLPHKVSENESDEDRIVISFNININHFK